jgi:hypothetical protein
MTEMHEWRSRPLVMENPGKGGRGKMDARVSVGRREAPVPVPVPLLLDPELREERRSEDDI